jgi:DHA2 family multidrug resistance protein
VNDRAGSPTAGAAPAVNPWLIAPVVGMAAFMEVLDTSIANVSLRHIAGDLSAGQDESTWVLTSYLVTNAIVLPISGWLSAVLGRKRFFLACIAGFTVSSLLCGLAPNLGLLIFFRALQGLTGGGLQPSAQAIMSDAFPPEKRGSAFAIYGIATVCAPVIGPTVGGLITDNATWRWIFFLNVPVGFVLFFLVTALISDPPALIAERARRLVEGIRIDYLGFALLALGLGCLQILLDKGQEDDWLQSGFIVVMAVTSALALVSFILWELGQDDPIVDLRLLANRNFGLGNLMMAALGFILLSSTVLLPELVQEQMGYTATLSGYLLSPGGIAVILLLGVVGRAVAIMDARILIVAGLAISGYSLYVLSRVPPNADFYALAWPRTLQGAGMALLFIPINFTAYVGVPRNKTSNAAAIINLSRNLGSSIGVSVITTLLARGRQVHQNYLVAHATPLKPGYAERLDTLTRHFSAAGPAAPSRALGSIYQTVTDGASFLSFLDGFQFMAITFFAIIPLVFLTKAPPRQGKPGAAVH